MNDYIKRDDAIENIDELYFSDKDDHDRTREAIKRLSFADVVEVVRCKDCRHFRDRKLKLLDDIYECNLTGLVTKPENYCNYGEGV